MEVVMYKNLNSKVLALCLNIGYATTLFFLIPSSISANIAIAAHNKAGLLANDQPSGFLWYKDEVPIPQKKPQESANNNPEGQLSKPQAAKARNDALKSRLDDAIAVVLDEPTVKNALAAQRMQKIVMDRSEDVSKVWMLAALIDSKLIRGDMNPNVLHRSLQQEEKNQQREELLKSMHSNWGLFLSVTDGCIYCQRFLPIVEQLQQEINMQVLAISKTGKDYGPFKGAEDTGLMSHLNPEGIYPLLFMANKDGKRIYPVARGLTEIDKIKENMIMVHNMDLGVC
jgi:conjugal transfer pilus assembly protein TraF